MSGVLQAGRRYAEALMETAKNQKLDPDTLRDELSRFATAVAAAPDFQRILESPAFSEADRAATLASLCEKLSLSKPIVELLRLLATRGRMDALAAVTEVFSRLVDEAKQRARAVVETAEKLSDAQANALRDALAKRTGRTIELDIRVDPTLLGGVRARIGSLVLDGTLRTQLDTLSRTLAAQ